jgi:hypothetical protein
MSSLNYLESTILSEKMKKVISNSLKDNDTQIQNNMNDYKILSLKQLSLELQLETGKGKPVEKHLETVIKDINLSGKYTWVQFFQLVDVFYVVVFLTNARTKTTNDEINSHYEYKTPENKPFETTGSLVKESQETAAPVMMDRDHVKKNMQKVGLPWAKNK